MSGWRYEIRLYAAQIVIGWAVIFTPAKSPHFLVLYDMIRKWKELG